MPVRSLLLVLLALASSGVQPAWAGLAGVDLYGSRQITLEDVRGKLGPRFEELERLISQGEGDAAGKLRDEIEAEIRAMGDFAYVGLSRIGYFREGNPAYYTIDLVDAKDAERRLAFSPEPKGTFEDPEGLLASWHAYEDRVLELLSQGKIGGMASSCPAFHCIVSFDHPDLAKYGETFEARVPARKETLKKILAESGDAQQRAAAAYLLAHIHDGEELLQALLPAIFDPDSTVRNNVLRVLQQMAREQKDLKIPLDPILRALDFPATTDRNKALATLAGLATRPELREEIARRAGETLIEILKLLQPNNHDYAYIILKEISGEEYGERDYDAWGGWVRRAGSREAHPSAE